MRMWKGLFVVLLSFTISAVVRAFSMFTPYYTPLTINLLMTVLQVVPAGVASYVILSWISHKLAVRIFQGKGQLDEIVFGFGVAHFPLILGALSFFLIFFGAVGFFAATFFGMFFSLMVFYFEINALVAFHKISWKKAFVTLSISALIIIGIFAPFHFLFGISLINNLPS